MDRCPVFCLKTEDDSDGTLRLLNESGIGNGIPTQSSFSDIDHRYNYATGDVGKVPLRQVHNLTISMDEVTPEVREALLDWKFKRKNVTLCDDGFGLQETESSVYLMKPRDYVSGVYSDETGRHSLDVAYSPLKYVWDFIEKIMVKRASGELVTERTSFGDGFRSHGPVVNLGSPSSPESATTGFGAGNVGWDLTPGTGLSIVHGSSFPNEDYTGEVRIQNSTDGLGTIEIPTTQLGVAPFAGEGSFVFIVWVKGNMGRKSQAIVGGAGNFDSQDFGGMVFDDWTPLMFKSHSMAWSGLSPSVLFVLNEATDETTDFYLGPHMACWVEGDDDYFWPHWSFDSTAISPGSGYLATKDTVTCPAEGIMTLDFVIPEDLDLFDIESFLMGLADFGGPGGRGRWFLTRTNSGVIELKINNSIDLFITISDPRVLQSGRHVWSVAYDSSNNQISFVDNGRIVEVVALDVSGWTGTGSIARMGSATPASTSSFYFLGMRLEEYDGDLTKLVQHQISLTDNVARGIYELSQGRWYEIVSVPQSTLIQDGGTLFIGDLVLKQTKYTGGGIWYAQEEQE